MEFRLTNDPTNSKTTLQKGGPRQEPENPEPGKAQKQIPGETLRKPASAKAALNTVRGQDGQTVNPVDYHKGEVTADVRVADINEKVDPFGCILPPREQDPFGEHVAPTKRDNVGEPQERLG